MARAPVEPRRIDLHGRALVAPARGGRCRWVPLGAPMIACAGVATAPVHGRADQALRMALALHAKGSTYALHVYANDGHGLPLNRADRIQRIVEWFSKAP